MSKPARNLLTLLCASALVVLMAAALNFVVDPLQLFRLARTDLRCDVFDG